MNPTAATWVRTHAWTDPVRDLAEQHPLTAGRCLCQQPFTSAPCSGGTHDCAAPEFGQVETYLLGRDGWLPDHDGSAVRLAGRYRCTHRCCCACHGGPAPAPVSRPRRRSAQAGQLALDLPAPPEESPLPEPAPPPPPPSDPPPRTSGIPAPTGTGIPATQK